MSVWFVTGASRGFGAGIVAEALARGNQVVATARRPSIERTSHLLPVTLDVTDEAQAAAAVDAAVQEFGRTDFLDESSLHRAGQIDDYADTVGALRGVMAEYNHAQPGDPVKAAKAIVDLAELPDPPLRIQLGADSVARVEAKLDQVRSELDRWRKLALSTDHDDV